MVLCGHISTHKLFAVKKVSKAYIKKHNLKKYILNEKKILQNNTSPFLCKLNNVIETRTKIWLVLDFVSGGDLFRNLKA